MANETKLDSPWSMLRDETIMMEILPYLPAKSVGRFRSVSRGWHAWLSSATFVELHLRRANKCGQPRLFFCPDKVTSAGEEEHVHVWQPGDGPVKKLMPKPTEFWDHPAPITSPLRGLLLVRSKSYLVYNPSTGSSLVLPDSMAPVKTSRRRETGTQPQPASFFQVSYGLGYCSVTSEYKVVRVFSDSYNDIDPPCSEVYVLGRPAYWRPTAHQPPPMCTLVVWENNPGVFLGGYLHFICIDGRDIITFHISNETFGLLRPPPPRPKDDSVEIELVQLHGSLCVCHGFIGYREGVYRMWMLQGDDDEPRWWRQLCSIDLTAAWSREPEMETQWIAPLYMFDGDKDGHHQKIMFGTGDCKVFTVDANGGTALETLLIRADDDDDAITGNNIVDHNHPSLGLFQESLVPVGRSAEEMVLSSPAMQAWFHILKWMPARSVADLSLVCREWRAMIMTDRFIQSHVRHANLNKSPTIKMIINPPIVGFINLQYFIDLGAPAGGPSLACSQPCHGLNVGSSRVGSFVCNPIMGYREDIYFEDDEDDSFAGRVGLGYNSETSKHVLVLARYKEKNMITLEYQLECQLRYVEEREWRPIDPPPRPILASTAPTYANGKICWLVEPGLGLQASPNCEVVAFNVQSEEFEVFQGPQCGDHHVGRMSILCLHGALCVACSNQSINVIDIWMMKDDSGTWLREYRIDLAKFYPEYSSEKTTLLTIDPKDGRILLSTGWSLGYYDPKTVALETIYSMEQDDNWKFSPIICDESLIFTIGLA